MEKGLRSAMNFDSLIHQLSRSRYVVCADCGAEMDRLKISFDNPVILNTVGYVGLEPQMQFQCKFCYNKQYNKDRSKLSISWRKDLGQL